MDQRISQLRASDLIDDEVNRQDRMWGPHEGRTDIGQGEFYRAAAAQLVALFGKNRDEEDAFGKDGAAQEYYYPPNWDKAALRDYGSDIANLAVAGAFIQQEIARLLRAGADTTRLARDPATQAYTTQVPRSGD